MTRHGFAGCATAAVLAALSILAAPAAAEPTVVASGLFDPRGIDAGNGDRLLVAQSGSGEITRIKPDDDDPPEVSVFAQLAAGGPVDVAASGRHKAYVVMGAAPEAGGEPFGSLLKVRRGGESSLIADIAAYQVGDPDPDDVDDPPPPEESNPNGLAVLGHDRFLVADAANNDLLLIDDGEITTVARFKTELFPWPDGLDFGPPPGTPVPTESVPTAVAVGPDGAWYVSELKGFPFPKGGSRIWRIEPGSTEATCDPEQPDTGPCQTFETGFTSVIDLAFGEDDELYVVEIAKESLLAVEIFEQPPIGALWRVDDDERTELEEGALLAPGGVTVADDETLYVTTGTFLGVDMNGVGLGEVVRIDLDEDDDHDHDDDKEYED